MDYHKIKHMKNFFQIAEMAASIGSNKPAPPEIKSVPHIKKTKKQLEFILKMPKPWVKWFEEDWVDGITVEEEGKLYQNLMNEKKKNEHIKNENEHLKKILDEINTNIWNLYDLFQEKRRCEKMRDIRWEVGQIMYHLGHNVGGSYSKKGKLRLIRNTRHYDDFDLNIIRDRDRFREERHRLHDLGLVITPHEIYDSEI